ncbi:hypothetical protein EJ110_NYTH27944 [Nymphaea thermarum]|nr:hypothetical protein EJ110_NYTH27944 [Nymphaea thermarum]
MKSLICNLRHHRGVTLLRHHKATMDPREMRGRGCFGLKVNDTKLRKAGHVVLPQYKDLLEDENMQDTPVSAFVISGRWVPSSFSGSRGHGTGRGAGRDKFQCSYCGKIGHLEDCCWDKHPHLCSSVSFGRGGGRIATGKDPSSSKAAHSKATISMAESTTDPSISMSYSLNLSKDEYDRVLAQRSASTSTSTSTNATVIDSTFSVGAPTDDPGHINVSFILYWFALVVSVPLNRPPASSQEQGIKELRKNYTSASIGLSSSFLSLFLHSLGPTASERRRLISVMVEMISSSIDMQHEIVKLAWSSHSQPVCNVVAPRFTTMVLLSSLMI